MRVYFSYSILFILLLFQTVVASDFGNEWINTNQAYYRIPIAQKGMYRLNRDFLLQQGVPVSTVDPRELQVWWRGEQIAIHIEGENDGVFNTSDYMLFWGRENEGALETPLYFSPQHQSHKYYSMLSDTTSYFITWNSGTLGKRITQAGQTVTATPQTYHIDQKLTVFTESYSKGFEPVSFINRPEYDMGQGWCSTVIERGRTYPAVTLSGITNTNSSLPIPRLFVQLVGRNIHTHVTSVAVGNSATITYDFPEFSGYSVRTDSFNIGYNQIESNQLRLQFSTVGKNGNNDVVSLKYILLEVPQVLNFSGVNNKRLYFNTQVGNPFAFRIENASSNLKIYDVSNPHNVRAINYSLAGTTLNAQFIPQSTKTELLVIAESQFSTPTRIERMAFEDDLMTVFDYLIVNHKRFQQPTQNYAAYRRTPQGGGFQVKTVDIDRVIAQYGYGEKSPLALRNYIRYLVANNQIPKYMFLIGSAAAENQSAGSLTKPYRKAAFMERKADGTLLFENNDFIPIYGNPGSDIMFSSQLGGAGYEPLIPTGRLSVRNPEEVTIYLNKVIEHEAAPYDAMWRKNILHLSGGRTSAEATGLLSYMNSLKTIAERPYLAGKVTTFTKQTSDFVELINPSQEINAGVSMITFLGHSAPETIDIDIGQVSDVNANYNNKGKYPLMIINGCQAGEFFMSRNSLGQAKYSRAENWLFSTPDKGSIACMAHTAYGYSSELYQYSNNFYSTKVLDSTFFHETIGNVQQETIRRFMTQRGSSIIAQTQAQQFILFGDPAVKVMAPPKPDYVLSDSKITVENYNSNSNLITISADSFRVLVSAENVGMYLQDSISVCVKRTYNNGQTSVNVQPLRIQGFGREQTIAINIPNDNPDAFGINELEVFIDCNNEVDELNEFNNTAKITFFVYKNGVSCLYPQEFAVVGSANVSLTAQSIDLHTQDKAYIFQLDTNNNFNNPVATTQITGDALATWQNVTLPVTIDSTVYYWRVRFVEVEQGSIDEAWDYSSFMYIRNKSGWGQGHFQQFNKDVQEGLSMNISTREWVYDSTQVNIEVGTAGNNVDGKDLLTYLSINDNLIMPGAGQQGCTVNNMFLLAFDKNTGAPYYPGGALGMGCGFQPRPISSVGNFANAARKTALLEYFDLIPEGAYLLMFSAGSFNATGFKQDVDYVSRIQQFGAQQFTQIETNNSYIFLGQKGQNQPILEVYADSATAVLSEIATINGKQFTGTVTTPPIGPASAWDTYYQHIDVSNSDQHEVQVLGIRAGLSDTLLYTIQANAWDSLALAINANEYPYLRLRAMLTDTLSLSVPQLYRWVITFDELPEGVVNPSIQLSDKENELDPAQVLIKQEGDSVYFSAGFINITDQDFVDSLTVRYTVNNAATGNRTVFDYKVAQLLANDTLRFAHQIPSQGLGGKNTLQVFVNPELLPEQRYSNNQLFYNFEVNTDNIHPVIDVTFDGIHIMNGDIVSPSPMIVVKIKDENKFLLKSDTTGMQMHLQYPCGAPNNANCPYKPVYFGSQEVMWSPATTGDDFKIEYTPQNLPDGMYTLRVIGQDASGNKSGYKPYEISFTVINASTITHFYPYPNPFSTKTRFVFTLTGAEIPDEIKIQIMTVSGIVVREITQDELGPLRIGNNISQYEWNGTDEYGDRLANGVYLYRVITRSRGEEIKHRETSADKAFHRNFGKMYILR